MAILKLEVLAPRIRTNGIGNVYSKDVDVADGEDWRQFLAGGADVPVTYVGSQGKVPSLSLVETYKRLKVS